jgi:hypothetical protein
MKELNEALVGINEFSIVVIGEIKDGLQLQQDIPAIMTKINGSDAVKTACVEAIKGIQLIPGEIAAAKITDWVALGWTQIQYVPKLLAAFKK